jgi:hypothetical protein
MQDLNDLIADVPEQAVNLPTGVAGRPGPAETCSHGLGKAPGDELP